MKYLLQNVTEDTNGDPIVCDGSDNTLLITGDFGGGSVTIQTSNDLIEWVTLEYGGTPAIFTEPKAKHVNRLARGLKIRATLTGSSGITTNVTVGLY